MFDTEASYIQNKWAQQSMQHIAIDSILQTPLPNLSLQDKSALNVFYSTVAHKITKK